MLLRRTTSLVIGSILIVALTACGTVDGVDEAPRGAAVATATVASIPTPMASVSGSPAVPTVANSEDPTPGIAEDAACDARISSSFVMFETLNDLVWSSHQVVTGTVTERLPSEKINVEGSVLPFTIVTDVIVNIDQQFRGQPSNQLRVRTFGGQIDGCAQEFPDSPPFEVGASVALFMREPDTASTYQVYEVVGGSQGYWTIGADGLASTDAVHLLPAQQPIPLDALTAAIVSELAAGPSPDSSVLDEYLVPASMAPIVVPTDGTPSTP